MRDTTVTKTTRLSPKNTALALILQHLDDLYIQDVKRIIRMLAAAYGLTVSE